MLSYCTSIWPKTEIKQPEDAVVPAAEVHHYKMFLREDVMHLHHALHKQTMAHIRNIGVAQLSLTSLRCCVIICHCALKGGRGNISKENPSKSLHN